MVKNNTNDYLEDDISNAEEDRNRKSIAKKLGIGSIQALDPFEEVAKQCQTEYDLAWHHQKAKKDEWEIRLRLYNNQKRDKKAVGDTTMFTIHQTVLASLYSDRLDAEWAGKESGDEEVANNLNALSENDYVDMEKDILDYFWDWDTLFFGRGLIAMEDYIRDADKKIYLPVPKNLDAITFLRDPYATSIHGNMLGDGAARDYGYEVKMTRAQLEESPHIFDDIDFRSVKHGSGTYSILRDAMDARDDAQGRQKMSLMLKESNLGVNAQYDITEWSTHLKIKGKVKKVKVWLANDRAKVIGLKVLRNDYWPVIDRPLYPTSRDWDGTSIPDLTEDKQRARAVAQNLGLNMMKADLHPSYIYDSTKITNRKDLKRGFDKYIPVDPKTDTGPIGNAISPLRNASPNMGLLDFIYTSLDVSAQKATATPDIQQGIQSEKDRPLGETNLIKGGVDTRYSLAAKVFGWSEKRFWGKHWYGMYKEYFKEDIDEKVLRIEGAFGAKWRKLMKDNIVAPVVDPDVTINSRILVRAKMLEERQTLSNYFALALQDPNANRRWALKKLGRLNGLKKDEVDRLFPPTIDELEAEEENEMLNENKTVPVLREQDHKSHNEVHAKANDTPAARAHIATHNKALMIRRTNPEFFPEQQQAEANTPPIQPGQAQAPGGSSLQV